MNPSDALLIWAGSCLQLIKGEGARGRRTLRLRMMISDLYRSCHISWGCATATGSRLVTILLYLATLATPASSVPMMPAWSPVPSCP